MNVLDLHVGLAADNFHVGKIPEAPDSQRNKPVRRFLGDGLGNRQHHHVHTVGTDEIVHLVHGIDRNAVDPGAGDSGRNVESGVHRKAGLGKGEILQKRVAQITHADHHQMVIVVHTQNPADFRVKLLHIVAVTLLSELPEAAQVLANLGGGDVHLLPQRMGGDAHHAFGAEFGQLPVVTGQPPDNGVGDIFFLQSPHSQSEFVITVIV